jgi:hypothetical protein
MANISSLYTLDQIVNEVLLTIPEYQRSERDYDRFLNFAVSGVRYLRLHVTKDGKNLVKIVPNAINRYDFPPDMESFIGLGVPANGKIWWLTRNDEIVTTKTVVGIDESLDTEDEEGIDLPTAQYNNWAATGGVNLQGYYTLDYEEREIIINSNQRSELLLAYVSSGINDTSISYIPAKYNEAIKAWILLQDIVADRNISESIKREYKLRFKEAIYDIKKADGMSLWELFDAWNCTGLLTHTTR